jgi:hypothetical protein
MNRAAAALAALALLPVTAAPAASITASRPHDPKLGCRAIKALIGNLNKGRLEDPKAVTIEPGFYSDRFGKVEDGEKAAFLHSLRHSEGRRDRAPIRLYRVYAIDQDKFQPIYLVVLERLSWHETRLETDGMLETREIRDPRYDHDTSYWLTKFSSNAISDFREAPEMFTLMDEARVVRHCYED